MLVLGCEGPMGPAGPAGKDGAPGAQGAAGQNGAAGTPGEAGAAGADGKSGIATTTLCNGTFDATLKYFYNYLIVRMQSGDVYATVTITKINSSWTFNHSVTWFFRAASPTKDTAPIIIDVDAIGTDNGGAFTFTYADATKSAKVVYEDPDVAGGQTVYDLPASQCNTFGN